MYYASEGTDFSPSNGKFERRGSVSSQTGELEVREAVVLGTSATMTPMTLPVGRSGLVQQSGAILSAGSPRASGLTLPVGTRSRTASGQQPMQTGRRLSFDVPATPESAYVGGSCASNYSFGMPMMQPHSFPTTVATAPATTIPEMNTLLGTHVAPTMVSGSGSPKARVISTTVGTAGTTPAFTSAPYNQLSGMSGYAPQQQSQQQSSSPYYFTMPPMQMQGPPVVGMTEGNVTSTMPFTNGGANDPSTQRLELGSLLPGGGVSTSVPEPRPGMVTTVMLRNIPLKYNREALLGDMDNRGFAYTYDFFYLPIDFHTGNNVGYAFINFIDEETVTRFKGIYNNLQLSADSAKICQVSEAKAQGKLKNIEQYRNSSVMNMEDKYQPVVFENGVRKPFPPPTRTLKPVKPRARAA